MILFIYSYADGTIGRISEWIIVRNGRGKNSHLFQYILTNIATYVLDEISLKYLTMGSFRSNSIKKKDSETHLNLICATVLFL